MIPCFLTIPVALLSVCAFEEVVIFSTSWTNLCEGRPLLGWGTLACAVTPGSGGEGCQVQGWVVALGPDVVVTHQLRMLGPIVLMSVQSFARTTRDLQRLHWQLASLGRTSRSSM